MRSFEINAETKSPPPSKETYDGEFNSDGHRHGTGSVRYEDGDIYSGQWVDGMRHGSGKMICHDAPGKRSYDYEGQWLNDMPEGFGTRCYADGRTEVGVYVAGSEADYGVRWDAERRHAARLLDGVDQTSISLVEAAALAAQLGVPVPALVQSPGCIRVDANGRPLSGGVRLLSGPLYRFGETYQQRVEDAAAVRSLRIGMRQAAAREGGTQTMRMPGKRPVPRRARPNRASAATAAAPPTAPPACRPSCVPTFSCTFSSRKEGSFTRGALRSRIAAIRAQESASVDEPLSFSHEAAADALRPSTAPARAGEVSNAAEAEAAARAAEAEVAAKAACEAADREAVLAAQRRELEESAAAESARLERLLEAEERAAAATAVQPSPGLGDARSSPARRDLEDELDPPSKPLTPFGLRMACERGPVVARQPERGQVVAGHEPMRRAASASSLAPLQRRRRLVVNLPTMGTAAWVDGKPDLQHVPPSVFDTRCLPARTTPALDGAEFEPMFLVAGRGAGGRSLKDIPLRPTSAPALREQAPPAPHDEDSWRVEMQRVEIVQRAAALASGAAPVLEDGVPHVTPARQSTRDWLEDASWETPLRSMGSCGGTAVLRVSFAPRHSSPS
jgi:hypothetical protein